ncbi:MAG: thiamine pyrophosphate-binding protein, partial [Nanoarchaeota archaeon]
NSYCCHHEQGCALAAEGYARQKNDIGVLSVTTGPGGTNAITGVAATWTDNIPLMVLSGQVRKELMVLDKDKPQLRQIGPQEINIVDIIKPITKYAVTIKNPEEIKYHLERAYYLARSGKPGPVWLDLPLDVQKAEIQEKDLVGFTTPKKQETTIPLEEIVRTLEKSKRPLMIIGQGVRLGKATKDLEKFIKKTGINVVSAMSGDDLVNEAYPYYLGRQGITGTETANYAVDNCDLLLILGTRMQTRQTSFNYQNFAKNAFKIMVDIDPAELNKKTLNIDLPICADAGNFLEDLVRQDITLQRWDIERKPILPFNETTRGYVDVYKFIQELSGKCDYPIITTNGMACEATHQAIRLKKNQRL